MTVIPNESAFFAHQERALERFWALGEEYIDWLFDAEEYYYFYEKKQKREQDKLGC